jgi:predicted metal-dependent enzyme (double-stranded beta helix superfamily)
MRRLILTRVLAAGIGAGCLAVVSAGVRVAAQAPSTSINSEPHHKRLLYTNDLRLWDVALPPGQSTQPFAHEYDVATVVIGDGTLNIQRNGEAQPSPGSNARGAVIVAEHTRAPAMYRIENTGTTEYRALEIENMREGNFPASTPFSAPGSSVLKESRAFTVYDVVLKPGTPEVNHDHIGSTIVVLISWGEFLYAISFLVDPNNYPLSVLIASQIGQYGSNWPALMAVAVAASLPILVIFLATYRLLQQGLAMGYIK